MLKPTHLQIWIGQLLSDLVVVQGRKQKPHSDVGNNVNNVMVKKCPC